MLTNKWYLVCPSDELKNDIRKYKILGEEIILFRNPDKTISALEDRCCHRNVNLSLGLFRKRKDCLRLSRLGI